MLRNQRDDEIPQLFVLAQLLLAINTNGALYATTKTPLKFWATWQEEGADGLAAAIHQAINAPMPTEVKLTTSASKGTGCATILMRWPLVNVCPPCRTRPSITCYGQNDCWS